MSYEDYIDSTPRNSSWVTGSQTQAQAAIDEAEPGDKVGVWYTTKKQTRSSLVTSGEVLRVKDSWLSFRADRGTVSWEIQPNGDMYSQGYYHDFVGWVHVVTVVPQEGVEKEVAEAMP